MISNFYFGSIKTGFKILSLIHTKLQTVTSLYIVICHLKTSNCFYIAKFCLRNQPFSNNRIVSCPKRQFCYIPRYDKKHGNNSLNPIEEWVLISRLVKLRAELPTARHRCNFSRLNTLFSNSPLWLSPYSVYTFTTSIHVHQCV